MDIDYLYKTLTKEHFFSKILKNLTNIIELMQKQTNKSQNIKDFLSKLAQNLTQNYFLKIQAQLQAKQEFLLVNFYSNITNYLANIHDKNQHSNKYLSDLLERLLTSSNNNTSNENFVSIIRLKFANTLLSSSSNSDLLHICEKKYLNFEYKLFNMGVHFYLMHDDNCQKKSNIEDIDNEENDDEENDVSDDSTFIKSYFRNLFEKYNLFKQLSIKIDSSIELMINDLILKYSFRFKLIEVLNLFNYDFKSFLFIFLFI